MKVNAASEENKQFIYLSDISYNTDLSYAASGNKICLDKNQSSDNLTLYIDGNKTFFIKGVCTWADSQIVYDLRNYDYDYFISYLGVDTSEQSTYFNTGLKFFIYTSDDCENWDLKYTSKELYGWSNAESVKIDIREANYLKIVVDDNSSNWWANWYDEANLANAKLIKEGYVEDTSTIDFIKTVEEYDEIIKTYNGNINITGDYELTLLQREFVNNVGYDILQALARYSEDYKKAIYWLMTDTENLRLYLAGGKPEGNYSNSIAVLAKLYQLHGEDLSNTEITEYGTVKGDLYRTMMLSISLTHSGNVYLWINGATSSDAVTRYEIYKNLHAQGKINCAVFETLTVEEMRWVMNTIIDDEEIVWLNDFIREKGSTNPYSYVKYTFGYNYGLDKYYSEENYSMWDEKYNLSKYNITYKKGKPKLWTVFEEGAVCGGISKTGSCIWGSYSGLPNTCVSQPGHCAYILYNRDENGNGVWSLWNDVSGWGQSGNTEHLNARMMNDWGMKSYATGWKAPYILLAQAAQNEYDKYEKAEKINMLAKVYQNDNKKLQEIYRSSLEIEKINLDAWEGLIEAYKNDNTKTEEDYYNLAVEVVDALNYYPLPMYNVLNWIKTNVSSAAYQTAFDTLQYKALVKATSATNEQSIQSPAVKQVANFLLGNVDATVATFSFDGENGGKIVLADKYADNEVTWDYSLDGGANWTQVVEHEVQLTAEEIASITAENDIKVHIIGVDYSEDNIFTIDILESAGFPNDLYANDLENAIIGTTNALQWKIDDEWNKYSVEIPNLTGDKTVTIRMGATGQYLAGTEERTYTFTEDNQPEEQKYISVKHLSIEGFSSENVRANKREYEYAANTIDGNINTWWHTSRTSTTDEKYIIIKLDEPRYLSKLQYIPKQTYKYGIMRDAIVSVSEDGENWVEAASITDSPNDCTTKDINFETSLYAQYIKLQASKTYQPNGNYNYFLNAAMINLFEDTTQETETNVDLEYSTTELTNQDVKVTLTSNKEITISNNEGSNEYVFTQNGEFTFEYQDKSGEKKTITAKVDWIDKDAPIGTISYNIMTSVNHDIVATLESNEEIIITNNEGKNTYTFTENGEFTFEFEDLAGNKGTAKSKVDWIDKDAPIAWIAYDIETSTSENVTATLMCDEEIFIENNNGSNTYIFTENGSFEFIYADKAGNEGRITATVNWINKVAPKGTISYDISTLTNKDVTATLNCDEEITITNNNGSNQYTFTKNGSFVFEFVNANGVKGSEMATVDWIDKEAPVVMISYNIMIPTNQDVVAILNCGENCEDEIIVTNNNGSNEYVFTENGEFTFEYEDLAGNKGTATAKVDWINKDTPSEEGSFDAYLVSSKNELNSEDEFTISFGIRNIENVENGLLALGGQLEYDNTIFDLIKIEGQTGWSLDENSYNEENFKFITDNNAYIKEDGIVFTVTLKVKENVDVPTQATFGVSEISAANGITEVSSENTQIKLDIVEKEGTPPTIEEKITSSIYTIGDSYITKITPGTNIAKFKENVETEQEMIFFDKSGNVLSDTDNIGTGMKLKVGKTLEFVLVVTGDIDGNGEIGINDLAKLKLHCIEKEMLVDEAFKAADMDADDKISVNDLATLKLVLLGIINL